MLKLSIVIPVYNVEKYISRCLDSVCNQDLNKSEYEILAIDDGSNDRSAQIIQEYQVLHPNIKLDQKPNGGLSSARNRGIELAKGKYIMFLDSDDFIEPDVLQELIERMEKESLDYLGYGINMIKNGKISDYYAGKKRPDSVNSISGLYYISNYKITISAWGHIAKTSIYRDNNLRFYEGIIHEDYPFMLQTYHFTNKMGFSNKPVYNYDIKPSGTITSTKSIAQSKRSLESWIYTLCSLQHVFEDTLDAYSNEAKKWLDWYKYLALAKLARCNISLKDKRYYLNQLKMCNALKITQYDKFDISRCIICRIYKQILPLIYHPHRQ